MIKNTLLLLLLFVTTFANAQTKVPHFTGSKATVKEAQKALDFHNKVRADVGVEPLEWSPELAEYAQKWADELAKRGCLLEHRPYSGKWKQIHGENIFWGSGGYTLLDASESWYSEIKYYKHQKLNGSNWYKTGHYTQMVWRNTTQVGIGIARCKDGGIIIVANYDPAGNYMGEKAY